MTLTGKVFFIISYESWGKMLMSKHHYAIELASAGNEVYFINHPDKRKVLRRGEVKIESSDRPNLFIVHNRLTVPYFFKFKFKPLFNFFMGFHINNIIRKVGKYPDVVWSFDTGNTFPLKLFPKSRLRILMPVDGPFGHIDELLSANKADVVISVTSKVLNVFKDFAVPKLLVNHGVANVFLDEKRASLNGSQLKVGYSGSLIRNDLDTDCFLTIIQRHPEIRFEFWGEVDHQKSNIHLPQDVEVKTLTFLETLRKMPNVVLHGAVEPETLAAGLMKMDALLICYSIKNDPNNHHKVLEYLGTGKVIISSYMHPYAEQDPDLISMLPSNQNNDELPQLFHSVITNLEHHNSPEKMRKRKSFARQYSYSNNVKRIEEFISANGFD